MALRGAEASFTLVPGAPVSPGGSSWSPSLMHHPTVWGAVKLSTGHPAVPRSVPQTPSPWKKASPASSISWGRDMWPCRQCPLPRRPISEDCAQQGQATLDHHISFFEVLGAHPSPSQCECREGTGLRGGHIGEMNTKRFPWAYSLLPGWKKNSRPGEVQGYRGVREQGQILQGPAGRCR